MAWATPRALLESELRNRHINWITNAKVASVEDACMHVEEIDEDGSVKHTTPCHSSIR